MEIIVLIIPIKFQNTLYIFKIFFCYSKLKIFSIAGATVKNLCEEERKKMTNISGVLVVSWY